MDNLNTLDVKIDKNQQVILQMKEQQNKLKVGKLKGVSCFTVRAYLDMYYVIMQACACVLKYFLYLSGKIMGPIMLKLRVNRH